jgi:hypothetical protein
MSPCPSIAEVSVSPVVMVLYIRRINVVNSSSATNVIRFVHSEWCSFMCFNVFLFPGSIVSCHSELLYPVQILSVAAKTAKLKWTHSGSSGITIGSSGTSHRYVCCRLWPKQLL